MRCVSVTHLGGAVLEVPGKWDVRHVHGGQGPDDRHQGSITCLLKLL